jgi:prepilin signal peptidase PulO-like enzyme (type II secretory pathway)
LKTREVSNQYWMVYGPLALVLFVGQLLSSDSWVTISISAGVTIFVAFVLFQLGIVGGADSKALMCLGLAIPVPPIFITPYWQSPFAFYPFPMVILINSLLLSVTAGLFILARNTVLRVKSHGKLFNGFEKESILRKILVMFTSYKTSFNLLRTRPYLYPAEQVDLIDSKPVRHFHLVSSVEEERNELVSKLEPYTAQGLYSDGVWVTPGLPHIIFILGSLLVSIILGDLLMWVFTRMVGYQT